ncbi:MAG: preprotein translocase subunit SecE [Gammaproteobacteria bacterium]|jgi:preprotein translocase subunit SecE|nr:preprotein translocase subunit SecE [Gammaproteobacteria bacterium]
MKKQVDSKKSGYSINTILSIVILVASLAVFYLNPLALTSLLFKVLILVAGLVVAGLVFISGSEGKSFVSFMKETKIELKKVVWPTREETTKTTGMIIIAVIIVSIFLWIVDAFFTWMVQLLTH